ncbi:C40 family peptidase [Nocardioides sp. zg-1228]|uniref:C40 family peptidase n=1 Tax=Nocardioides sp. zg-1228 TaxID=2763008 RepID=UPI0016435C8A|nr:C40 family peptidase [Nocardioides sp. zg-1228]MBC2933469.1 C40 family peptidase [Nocardioides sp. zg-1228]QSF56391.1 C40 family peptidase [Nocardioides sp. zg-1228]
MAHTRKRVGATVLGLSAIAAIAFVPATPAQADPDIDDVKVRVDDLYHEAEAAQERLHDARLDLADLRRDLRGLKADQERQDERLDAVRDQVSDAVVRQLEGEGISTMGQIVVSEDPGAFLDSLSTMSSFNDLQSSLLSDYDTELQALEIRREATSDRTDEIAELTEQLSAEKDTVDDKLAEAKELLADLEAEERERMLASRSATVRTPSSVPASGRAAAAVQYAMAQVGDAYVYGAMGENAFDCSGLTMRAWAQAGVSLPHSSSAQFGSGPRIAASDLQPGDLVFYYSPISHVGMYIGNGMIVHAANPGTGVVVSGLHSMPYVGAVRPG